MTLSRRNVIIGAVAGTWLVLLLLTFLLVRSSQQSPRKAIQQITPSATQVNRQATELEKQNLLINRAELDQAERDFNSKIGKSSTVLKKKSGFTFQLSPSLKKATTPTPVDQQRVLAAATTCNIDTAPSTIYVYDLKSHWAVNEATNLAKEYGVDSPPYSLPTSSSSFQYQFTSKDNKTFFNLFEASGKYRYHLASATDAASLDAGAVKDRSNAFITQHKLNNKIGMPTPTAFGPSTLFTYKRILDDFKLTDSASVQGAIGQSLCDVIDSAEMGSVEVEVRQDGKVTNLFNNTRTILGSYKAQRLTLEEAVAEFGASQPVEPIVIPPSATVDVSQIQIDTAVLAYYDIGANFGQTLYVPMYIGRGTVGGGAQVIGFFPAVSATELLKKGLVKTVPKSGNAASQQQGTLGFATPTPHAPPPPPASGPVGEGGFPTDGGTSMLGCPGGLVDYQIQCGVAGRMVCAGAISAPSSSDPLNACASGCKNISGTVTYQAGSSPCDAFLQQKSIPAGDRKPVSFPGAIQQLKSGDQLTCSLNACPC